ncbi:hypothetical protein [Salipiger abyssi]|uniref:Glutamate synthase (NADPH) large chain n=1 Tax=Salipiger abyssi TaxID=1250539 RepID=A0A1P8URT2_9RHOB|nr:hypothetical protein [Salipiger abyssi]APZ52101.1 Glutamate synthase (NADPH) large chain [Salipiger abyssi]MBN9886801.1 hypothetical protein [Salipiger abyssi]
MAKLIAILNVVAWAGFWAFGYLALTANSAAGGQVVTALILAALGGALGLWAWFWLVSHSERTGYADAPKRAFPDEFREREGHI